MDNDDWTENLTPAQAQAALDALKANKAPTTHKEAVRLLNLRRVLEAKALPPVFYKN